MLQISLLLMKSLYKTETPIFLSVVCSLFPKAIFLTFILLFVALWFILRGDLLYVFPCVILFLCFSVLLVLRLLEKYSVSLKTLHQQGISEPEFYGDLVYRFRKIVGKSNFSEQFRKLINRYKRIGYSLDIMRQTAIVVDGYALLFNCTTAVRASDSMTASS